MRARRKQWGGSGKKSVKGIVYNKECGRTSIKVCWKGMSERGFWGGDELDEPLHTLIENAVGRRGSREILA